MMTKKKVTSTYRREYSPQRSASRASAIKYFDANFNYREYRRQAEHGHHRSPFVWDDWEYELCPQQQLELQQRKVDNCCRNLKSNKSESSSSHSSYIDVPSSHSTKPDTHPSQSDQQCQTSAPFEQPANGQHCEPKSRLQNLPYSDEECNCGAPQPARKARVQGQPARVLSDTISKRLKKVSKKHAQADFEPGDIRRPTSPFAQFGIGDDELETGAKRTYNVLSQHGVYPTAIEAKHRLNSGKELRRKRSKEEVKEVNSKTSLHDPEFDKIMDRQTSKWQSEYKKNYRQFPNVQPSRRM